MSARSFSALALFALTLGVGTLAGCAQDDAAEDQPAADEGAGEVPEQDLTASTTQKLKVGQTAHFAKFDVTLRKLVEGTDFEVGFDIKVCAKQESNRVSWAPWGMKTVWGTVKATSDKDLPWSGGQLYPNGKILKAGECAQGIVPFINNDGETIDALVYRNSLGDTATWK